MRKVRWPFTVILVVLSIAVFAQSGAQTPTSRSTNLAQSSTYTVFANDLAGPRGLVFGPSGELYVAEQSGGSVARIGGDGRVVRIAKGFSHPHDLAIDAQGNLYLADSGANRIARISPSGEVTTYIDKVQFPVDLDFNPQGELLICELYRGRVVALRVRKWSVSLRRGSHGRTGWRSASKVRFSLTRTPEIGSTN